ncbi:hypothetical protein CRG98_035460 [Punica granatum]|uniref:Uncharacterized protein n=1 Tax=Punica granatum TaxID=22663 RepID=A0A2I0IJI7_PUNGR|nr:hypothetical protein CRG98_035460 [Punica granatum]
MHAEGEIEASVLSVSVPPPPAATGAAAAKASPPRQESIGAPTPNADADEVSSATDQSITYASIDHTCNIAVFRLIVASVMISVYLKSAVRLTD